MKWIAVAILIFFAALFGLAVSNPAFARDISSSNVGAEPINTAKDIREVCQSKSLSDSYRSRYEESWASAQRKFEEQVRNDVYTKRVVEDQSNRHYVQFSLLEVQYQSVIIYAFCYKKTIDKHLGSKSYETAFDACIEEQADFYQQMLRFTQTYGHLDNHGLNITVCKAKSEMLDVESNCPPYDWMLKIAGTTRPKAYDARAFLDCVRK